MLALYFTWLLAATEPFAWGPVKGLHWEAVPLASTKVGISVMAAHPRRPGLLLVGGRLGGLWRSDTNGKTWQATPTPVAQTVQALLFHPHEPDWILAGTVDGILESRDAGLTWTEARTGLPKPQAGDMTAPTAVLTLVPSRPLRVLAGFGTTVSTAISQHLGHIYQSDDWGSTWQLIHTGYGNIRSICFSETHPMQGVMASTLGLFHSINSGTSWRRIVNGLPMEGVADVFFIHHPFAGFVLTMDSNARFVSKDNGTTWTAYPGKDNTQPRLPPSPAAKRVAAFLDAPPGPGLSLVQAGRMAYDPLEPDVFALLTRYSIWITQDNGQSFFKSGHDLPDGFMPRALIFSRSRKAQLFCWAHSASTQIPQPLTIFTSRNNGTHWEAAARSPEPVLHDLLTHHHHPLTWLSLTQGMVHKTLQAGAPWSPVLLLPNDGQGGFFTPHPTDPDRVLLTWGGEEGGLWESHDWGRHWSRRFPALPHTRGHAVITDRGEILVCAGPTVWRYDLNRWTPLKTSDGADALDLAIINNRFIVAIFGPQPDTPAGAPGKAWYSPDYGYHWYPCRDGLCGPAPCSLASRKPSEGQLILGTRGGGFYQLAWPNPETGGTESP